MKILFLADEESKVYWDYFKKEQFEGIDLIISCGDLKPEYLSFLATLVPVPLLYVHGNHDDKYDKRPPEGCICIEDRIYNFNGIRILGLGGSYRYKDGVNQYTELQMARRIAKLKLKLTINRGFDILVTHSPAYGFHDGEDQCHRGFDSFNRLINTYHPKYFVHGHVHMNYGRQFPRVDEIGDTKVINAFERYILEV
ncbi:MAG: metallophosphoesterase [Lachnobacterium sp.]|nr:metallophosphoesterase [Lachnobacterium sp.]MCI7531944.1 metallophosphoesterase [Lachnobacterium sp.]